MRWWFELGQARHLLSSVVCSGGLVGRSGLEKLGLAVKLAVDTSEREVIVGMLAAGEPIR